MEHNGLLQIMIVFIVVSLVLGAGCAQQVYRHANFTNNNSPPRFRLQIPPQQSLRLKPQ